MLISFIVNAIYNLYLEIIGKVLIRKAETNNFVSAFLIFCFIYSFILLYHSVKIIL